MEKSLGIQLVSEITGISIYALRAWEKRYQLLQPARTPTARRLYDQRDVQKLLVIKELVRAGGKIKDVAAMPKRQIDNLLNSSRFRHLKNLPYWSDAEVAAPEICAMVLAQLLLALEEFDLERIQHEFSKLSLATSPKVLALEIFSPLLRAVGELTAQAKLSIAHEHALSSLIDRHLNSYLHQRTGACLQLAHRRPCVILATPPGEQHAFGIKLASLLCQEHTWNEYNLGTQLPLTSLLLAVEKLRPRLIILGIAYSYHKSSRRHSALLDYLSQVRRALPMRTHLVIGGPNHQWQSGAAFQNKFTHFFSSLNELDRFLKQWRNDA